MTTQFSQMSLSRQSSGDNPDSPSGPVYPSPIIQQSAPQTGYIMAPPSQQLPPGGFTGSGPPVSQQVLQPPAPPQSYVQQPPPAQVSIHFQLLSPPTPKLFYFLLILYDISSTVI